MNNSYFIEHPSYCKEDDMTEIGYNKRTKFLETLNAMLEEHSDYCKTLYEICLKVLEGSGYTINNKELFKEDIVFWVYISGAYSLMC